MNRTLVEYRIERFDAKFVAVDSDNEIVGSYSTEEEAQRNIDRAKLEDAVYQHGKILFHAAVASIMNNFDMDREQARYWVAAAAESR
jgi:hypothetical protein